MIWDWLLSLVLSSVKYMYVCQQVVVRVKFPDRLILQAFFRPMEKGKCAFVVSLIYSRMLLNFGSKVSFLPLQNV